MPLELDSGYMDSPFYGSTNSSPRPPLNVPNSSLLNNERGRTGQRDDETEGEYFEVESMPRKLTTGKKIPKEGSMEKLAHCQRRRGSRMEKPKQLDEQGEEAEILGQQEWEKVRKMGHGQGQPKWRREQKEIEMDRGGGMKDSKHLPREKSDNAMKSNKRTRAFRAKHKNGGLAREKITEDDSASTSSSGSVASKTM